MNINEFKSLATLIRDNDTYKVYDLPELESLTVSLTELNPLKETGGHSHNDSEEVYVFFEGIGTMQNGDDKINVQAGDIIPVPKANFHKVWNTDNNQILKFWAIFQKYEGRGK